MRIGEAAERAGVHVETLRYYERRGILPAPARSPAGHRSYDDETVRFVRAIKEAQGLGFTLAEIEEYVRLARSPGRAPAGLRARVAAKIDEVDRRLASLRLVRDDLARVLGCACDSVDRCTCGAAYLARRGRDPEPAPADVLHVTNGESAGNTLRQTELGGAVLSWDDVLYEGPVPMLAPEALRPLRARFLSECGWGAARAILHGLERRDALLERALAEERPVVLWFEHDLYDQLQLLQILALAAGPGESGSLELLNVGAVEGRPDFHGLGELRAEELTRLWPLRRPVEPGDLVEARAAWDALRAPEPTGLAALAEAGTPHLSFLAPALRRLLEELPDARSGLARSERQLLEPLLEEPLRPFELFLASQAREEAPFDGDAWVWRRLALLGGGPRPLLALADGGPVPPPPPPPLGDGRRFGASRLALTDAGRAVLAGDEDRVELLGLDRWLGGTHLRPDQHWRLDGGRIVEVGA